LADGIFGVDDAIMGGIECYWWKFWRRLWALTEQLPRPVALADRFEVATGGSALMNDNLLVRTIKGDSFSSIDFWSSLLGQLCTTSN
jgi:hypothetical protein